jgi:hypothetical protein
VTCPYTTSLHHGSSFPHRFHDARTEDDNARIANLDAALQARRLEDVLRAHERYRRIIDSVRLNVICKGKKSLTILGNHTDVQLITIVLDEDEGSRVDRAEPPARMMAKDKVRAMKRKAKVQMGEEDKDAKEGKDGIHS